MTSSVYVGVGASPTFAQVSQAFRRTWSGASHVHTPGGWRLAAGASPSSPANGAQSWRQMVGKLALKASESPARFVDSSRVLIRQVPSHVYTSPLAMLFTTRIDGEDWGGGVQKVRVGTSSDSVSETGDEWRRKQWRVVIIPLRSIIFRSIRRHARGHVFLFIDILNGTKRHLVNSRKWLWKFRFQSVIDLSGDKQLFPNPETDRPSICVNSNRANR